MDQQAAKPTVRESVHALLAGAIDYAGLFPPSTISMADAVLNYATYRNSNYRWMLGRFVVTAARLEEFVENARDFISHDDGNAWRVAVVVGEDVAGTLQYIDSFNAANGPGVICDTVEIKTDTAAAIDAAIGWLPPGIVPYFELPTDESMPDLIAALSIDGHRAKIRTGGVTVDSFPRSTDIIRFVRGCLAAGVKFKATAGLHHPIRCFRPLTYENNAPEGTMHGFLNLFLMTGFARDGFKPSRLEDVMEEEFEEVFRFDDQTVTWREEHTLNLWQIEKLRSAGIQSFGSCSFDEPIAALQKLGIL